MFHLFRDHQVHGVRRHVVVAVYGNSLGAGLVKGDVVVQVNGTIIGDLSQLKVVRLIQQHSHNGVTLHVVSADSM